MASSGKKEFLGQKDKITFNLEQVECLSSRIRADVFWAFSSKIPESVAEVAKGLGKSAQTVHYHVKELLAAGLLLAVETRQSRSRTETLYVHAARLNVDQGAQGSTAEYALRAKGFRAIAKAMVEETGLYYDRLGKEPDVVNYSLLARDNLLLSPEKFAEFRRRMKELLAEMVEDQPAEGVRMHIMLYARPTQGQYRKWNSDE